MIGAALAKLTARLEGRHWTGVAASLVLHILVVLLFPQPVSEPKPMTFEVALTPPPASQLPTPLSHKLSKQTAKKPPSTRTARQKRRSDSLDLAWKRERQPRRDAPKVSLPDPQVAASAEEQPRLARPQAVKPPSQALVAKPAAEAVEPGLSDPGSGASGQVQAAQPGRDIGVALAVAQSLAMAPGRVSGGLTAQGAAQAASAQGNTGAAGTALANSQQSGGAGVNVAGQGAGSRDGATAQAQSGVETKGVRLSAASHLGGMAALTAAGTTVAAPMAGEAGRANAADAARGGGFAAASSGARAAASPQAGAAGGGRNAVAGGAVGAGDAGAGEANSAARGGSATGTTHLASSGMQARSQAPVAGRGAGPAPGQSTRPEASVPAASGTAAMAASASAPRAGGAQSPALAMVPGSAAGGAGGGQVARTPKAGSAGGEVSAGGEAGGGRAVAASDGEGGRKPGLQNTRVVASKLIRPDSEAQALDVLAPSSFCPLPGHQPANQAPQSPNQDPAKAGYAANNPGLFFPVLAMAQGREGKVTVRVEVLPDGHAGKTLLKQSSGSSILDEDARNQLTRLRFTPVQRNGQSVTSWIDVPVTYRLSNK